MKDREKIRFVLQICDCERIQKIGHKKEAALSKKHVTCR